MTKGTSFQSSWLSKLDVNGIEVGNYIKPVHGNNFLAYCLICNKKFSTKSGFCKINEHAGRDIHLLNLFKIKKTQLKLHCTDNLSNTSNKSLDESYMSGK